MTTTANDVRPAPRTEATPRGAHAPGLRWVVAALIALVAFWGFVGGASFISDPTGAGLQAKLAWLERTPVDDFRLPGWFLLGVFGIGGLLVSTGLLGRGSPGPLRRLDAWIGFHWSWAGAIAYGVVLVVWIVYEVVVMPERIWIQPALIVVGALIATTPVARSMRRWYAVRAAETERV